MNVEIKEVWICPHPKESHFDQITNNEVKYDLVFCRDCGKLVEKKPKP